MREYDSPWSWKLKMLSKLWALLAALVILVPLKATAQEVENPYLKRGLFVGAEYGAYILLKKPDMREGMGANTLGSMSGFELGYDLSFRLSIHALFWAVNVSGDPQAGGASGSYVAGLGAKYAFVRSERFFAYVKAGAGFVMSVPGGFKFSGAGLLVHGGLGVRLHTRLRGFSVAADLLGVYSTSSGSFGLGVLPAVIYTF